MMQTGTGSAIAAVFADHRRAEASVEDLKRGGFAAPWLAVAKPATVGETHEVASSSDGVLGAVGRFFSAQPSLRRGLIDHGIGPSAAAEIDAVIAAGGAVVVVAGGERIEVAAAILSASGGDVHGAASPVPAPYARPHPHGTVAGQGDDLDRGTGRNASGGAGSGIPKHGRR